jgi:hypothetical protein
MKGMVLGIVILCVGASITSTITGYSSQKKNDIFQLNQPDPANITITDWTEDVISWDPATQEGGIVIYHPDINIENLDITQATYSQQGTQAILCLQVDGIIENRREPENPNGTESNFVLYIFELVTFEHYYLVEYCNQSGYLHRGNETINLTSSYFSVVNDTLTITFSLISEDEIYKYLKVASLFRKTDLSGNITANIFDKAPNYLQKAFLLGRFNIVTTAEDHILIEAVNLRILFISPLQFSHYNAGEMIIISDQYKGRIIGNHFLIGMFNVFP